MREVSSGCCEGPSIIVQDGCRRMDTFRHNAPVALAREKNVQRLFAARC
jgi:hypothetical protein